MTDTGKFMKQLSVAVALICLMLSGCSTKKAVETIDKTDELASVNGEILDEGDFERSQGWMPSFVRQLESNSTLELSRFWGLIHMIVMAQDAQDKGVLSQAERSFAIKEALAARNIAAIPYPNYVIEQSEIDAWLSAHPEKVIEPAAYTVNYALVKNEQKIPILIAVHGMANGAQMGYNFMDPPPLDRTTLVPGPLTRNIDGHSISAKKFNYIFATNMSENKDVLAQMGPFTAEDGLLFSCPEAIKVLSEANIGRPLNRSIACSGDWVAFVIPEWKKEAAPMNEEKARQVAIESITADKRALFRDQYIQELLVKQKMATP